MRDLFERKRPCEHLGPRQTLPVADGGRAPAVRLKTLRRLVAAATLTAERKQRVEELLAMLERDRSGGIHNGSLTQKLFTAAESLLPPAGR